MTSLDLVVIALYFIVVGWVGWASSKTSLLSSRAYFLGGGHIGWLAIGASLFATNISAEHFIGLAGTGASSGLAVGQFEWLACLILLLLGWLFAPYYLRTGVFTMPEFLEKRYSPACRTYLSAVSLIAYVFTKVSVAVYAGAIVLQTILGWNIWTGAVLLIVATGVYTLFGGLRAVIYTDYFQAGVLVLGGFALTFAAIAKVGGVQELIARTDPSYFNLWKPLSDPEFPWTGILFGAPILGIWYWCTDQVIVQRALAAEKISVARKATIFAGFLKILPVFILVLPGIAGRLIFPTVAPDRIYATMVQELLPSGLKGLVVAGLLAALMSSLSSVFNSSSTLVVMDFYRKRRPNASEKELVRAGQVSTAVLVAVGLLWIPFIGIMSNQLYVYLQSVQAYISPPIAAVFLAGIFWKRANSAGAFAALLSGFILGALRFVSEIGVKAGWLTDGPLVPYAKINFLHFAVLLFFVSVSILLVFGLARTGGKEGHARIFSQKVQTVLSDDTTVAERMWSLALVAIVLIFWLVFSPVFFK